MNSDTIQVDIWSDIVCPFCYIGKRNFESAVHQTGLENAVNVVWHSFELAPDAVTDPNASIYDVLGKRKGWSAEQSRQIHDQMEERARASGLEYDFARTIPANSRNAHRLLHVAKQQGVQNTVKELLMKGYFTEGRNIDSPEFLTEVGMAAGLNKETILTGLKDSEVEQAVSEDIELARRYGIQGVPFFVFHQKYAVSGAQPAEAFVNVLKQVAEEIASEKA